MPEHKEEDRPLATISDSDTDEEMLTLDDDDDGGLLTTDDDDDEDDQQDFGDESGRPWTENDAPRLTDEELGIPQAPIHPIELPTRRDYTIATQALQFRKTELERLAKKTADAGYPKEARTLEGDAAAIGDVILPQFKTQIEMPLVSGTELNYGIKNALKPLVHAAAVRINHAGDARADADHAEASLIDQLAIKVGSYAREVATQAFNAGVAYRESEPAAIAQKALDSLRGTGVA